MSVALTSTSTTSKLTANGVDVLSTDATGEVSAKINGTLQPIQTAIVASDYGVSQTPQDFTSSRSFGTTFTNPNTKAITLYIQYASTSGSAIMSVSIDGGTAFPVQQTAPSAGAGAVATIVIPAQKSYAISVSPGSPTLSKWVEVR